MVSQGDRIFISVGSNIDPEHHVPWALRLISEKVSLQEVSVFYRTRALDRPEQDDYLNGIIRVATSLPPRLLKTEVLRDIERQLKRVRTEDSYAPRTIDLDLILYNDLAMGESDLVLPDPDIRTRWFVALPLHQLAPDLVMPDTGRPLQTIVDAMDLPEALIEKRFKVFP